MLRYRIERLPILAEAAWFLETQPVPPTDNKNTVVPDCVVPLGQVDRGLNGSSRRERAVHPPLLLSVDRVKGCAQDELLAASKEGYRVPNLRLVSSWQ